MSLPWPHQSRLQKMPTSTWKTWCWGVLANFRHLPPIWANSLQSTTPPPRCVYYASYKFHDTLTKVAVRNRSSPVPPCSQTPPIIMTFRKMCRVPLYPGIFRDAKTVGLHRPFNWGIVHKTFDSYDSLLHNYHRHKFFTTAENPRSAQHLFRNVYSWNRRHIWWTKCASMLFFYHPS